MELKNFTYLLILMASIAIPFALSFDKKVQYYKNLKFVFPAILITAIFFWIWDILFTANQVWSFNSGFTLGKQFQGLPIEEWLFFIVMPYACVFIYEVLKYYLGKLEYANTLRIFSILLIIGFSLLSISFRHQAYTFLTFFLSAVYLGYNIFQKSLKTHLTIFYLSYFVSLIPFIVVDEILTSLTVVQYNSSQIINIRILHIPVEDFSYFFLLLLMVTNLYEILKESKLHIQRNC